MRLFIATLSALVILTACSMDKQYYLKTADARGLKDGDIVYRQGIEVGEVTKVAFDKSDVLVTIEINEALYEDQGFEIDRNPAGDVIVELGRPEKEANELKPGATIEEKSFGSILGKGFGQSLEETLNESGRQIEQSIEEVFGKDGEKLQNKLESIFGENGEKLEAKFEKLFGKDGEKIEKGIENIIGKDGEKIKDLFGSLGAEFEEIGKEIEAAERLHGKDSPEFKAAVEKALREWAESN